MITRHLWAEAARSLIDPPTPFSHSGRQPGVGVDCAGIPVLAARALGLPVVDRLDYALHDDNLGLFASCAASIADPWEGDPLLADFVALRLPLSPFHVALVTPDRTAIHVHFGRSVIEEPFPDQWLTRVRAAWTLRGVPR